MGRGRIEFDPFERFLDLSNVSDKGMEKDEKNLLQPLLFSLNWSDLPLQSLVERS